MAVEHVRISQDARDKLIKLKRVTGIKNWNVLCRWGLCASLAETSRPPSIRIPRDSTVDMTWKVFGGADADVYWALVRERCRIDGLPTDEKTVGRQFRLHLHRGIGYLAGMRSLASIDTLFETAPERGEPKAPAKPKRRSRSGRKA